MQDSELYHCILGLEPPWSVAELTLKEEDEQIDFRVEHPAGSKFNCPDCGESLACYDHAVDWHLSDKRSCRRGAVILHIVGRIRGVSSIAKWQVG